MTHTMMLDRDSDPHFSQPIRQIVAMLVILVLVVAGVTVIYVPVLRVFEANIILSGFIAGVFLIGVLACFWQVFQLFSAVSWIEGFALDRPGHDFTRPPQLLASLAALLRGKDARRLLTASSTRSILDTVATRLDEVRDITRYITNLLIFLGLLGTFWGLANTIPGVVDTIRSLAPREGEVAVQVFGRLMSGLESQLGGMGTAFSTSLLGLAGSLVLGLLELFAGHGQNRFYRELEEWLSSITRIGLGGGDSEGSAANAGAVITLLDASQRQIETLADLLARAEDGRKESDARLSDLTGAVTTLVERLSAQRPPTETAPILERIAASQADVAARMKARDTEDSEIDTENRARLRNIDLQLLRILEEMSVGRQDAVAELRTELNTLSRAITGLARGEGR